MSERGPSPLWVVLGVVGVALLVAALVFGPGLYEKGRQVVAPIVKMSRIENRMEELDREVSFQPPDDGKLDEERLETFLEVRMQVLPHLREWVDMVEDIEERGDESFDDAAVVLTETQDLLELQHRALVEHGMSPSEFKWLDQLVYGRWWDGLRRAGQRSVDARAALHEVTSEDLRFVRQLQSTHGRSRPLERFEARLEERLAEVDGSRRPSLEGMPETTQELLWRHRERIEKAAFDDVRQAPIILSEFRNVNIEIRDRDHEPE